MVSTPEHDKEAGKVQHEEGVFVDSSMRACSKREEEKETSFFLFLIKKTLVPQRNERRERGRNGNTAADLITVAKVLSYSS